MPRPLVPLVSAGACAPSRGRLVPRRAAAGGRRVRVRASAGAGEGTAPPRPSRTQMIMDNIDAGEEVGGAYSYSALKRLDQVWSSIRDEQSDYKVPEVVTCVQGPLVNYDVGAGSEIFDVLVCSGTLGIFVATALCYKGLRVGIIERNKIKGREQEWNISRKELMEIVEIGILSEAEVEQIISSDFNPNRCGFENKGEIWVENILHLGIS